MTGAITSILKQDAPSYSLEMSSTKLNLRLRAKIDRKRASVGDHRATRSLTDTGELSGIRTFGRRRPIMSGCRSLGPKPFCCSLARWVELPPELPKQK
jgi:hypothetical protein